MNISISMDKSLFENETARELNISTRRLKDGGNLNSFNIFRKAIHLESESKPNNSKISRGRRTFNLNKRSVKKHK